MNTSKLLIEEPPLQVLPSLAVRFGLFPALFLQQLHYWLRRSTVEHGGYRWVYNTLAEWQQQFPFVSVRTIQRAVYDLEQLGVVVGLVGLAPDVRDRTKFYRIDYTKLDAGDEDPINASGQAGHMSTSGPADAAHAAKMAESNRNREFFTESTEKQLRAREAEASEEQPPAALPQDALDDPLSDPEMATSAILDELAIGGQRLRLALSDVVRREMKRRPGSVVVEAMCAAWREYQAADVKFRCNAERFFGEGVWREPKNWERKEKKLEIKAAAPPRAEPPRPPKAPAKPPGREVLASFVRKGLPMPPAYWELVTPEMLAAAPPGYTLEHGLLGPPPDE